MLQVTDRACSTFAGLLEAHSETSGLVLRLVVEDGNGGIEPSAARPGDMQFAHGERTVLVVEADLAQTLGDRVVDAHEHEGLITVTIARRDAPGGPWADSAN